MMLPPSTTFFLCCCALLLRPCCLEGRGGGGARRREGKFLNIFQVIRFSNSACAGSGARNGTCYTEAECTQRGGVDAGSCAAGFGVCCVISVDCGQTTSENCTYFDSGGDASTDGSTCQATVCPCGEDICQLRLDFDTFVLTGPSAATDTVTRRVANSGAVSPVPASKAATRHVPVSATGQCLTDSFAVTNPDGAAPPVICGVNTGEHMYVESSFSCNSLNFKLGSEGVGTSIASRSWSIKVTQFSCTHPNLAPEGCVQYFYGEEDGSVRSFNYDGGSGRHLASQDQQICVRLCWTTVADADFAVSGMVVGTVASNTGKVCCSYGAASSLTAKQGFDCVHIPGAVGDSDRPAPVKSNICGNGRGLAAENTAPGTVCTTVTPFSLLFRSDQFEVSAEASVGGRAGNAGFELVYVMDAVGCNAAET